ncbi:MAG: hypothetical protein R3A10_05910 [Caldilineaceae bacterium]
MIPHVPGVKVDRVEAFAAYLVVHLREGRLRGLRHPRSDGEPDLSAAHTIRFNDAVYTVWGGSNLGI